MKELTALQKGRKERASERMAGHRASKKHMDTWAQGHCLRAGKGRKWSGNDELWELETPDTNS